IDHVSDSFLDTTIPLLVLIEAAKNGREKEIKEYAAIFREHTSRLVEVANLACSLSTNEDGIKIVQMAANHIETLCPQVINAALALAARPKSQVVKNSMEIYKSTWENRIHVLTEAVDDITSIDDFLAVSEGHILEDVNKCILALREQDADDLDRAAGAIRGRAARVAHIVSGEMDSYEPGVYTGGVMKKVQYLTNTVIPEFVTQVNIALESLSRNTMHQFDDNQFVDISKKVYDTIHDIRCSVMVIRVTNLNLCFFSQKKSSPDTRAILDHSRKGSSLTVKTDFSLVEYGIRLLISSVLSGHNAKPEKWPLYGTC
uniref:Uncharacterized protein n=1 Tax=Chrysemys picta bellii TaxID=8478 RepID=A0A8C3I2Y2_CHRPI